MRTLLVFGLLWLLTPNFLVHAQLSNNIVGDGIHINLVPQYPNPGQTVTASFDDYSINNTGGTIEWFADSHIIASTTNNRTITFTAPNLGQSLEIAARLTFSKGQTLVAKQSITPIYLDVIIEPQTYTPVFYQGRALPVNGALINLNALVENRSGLVDSTKYTYNWLVNNKSVYGGPKKGNSWAQFSVPYGDNALVSVTVQNEQGVTVAKKTINLPMSKVNLQFYELNTLYGLSQKAVSDQLILIGNSTTIRAVPYNLDTRVTNNNSLFSEWNIDGTAVQTQNNDPFEISLLRAGGHSSNVGFKIRNLESLIQGDEKSFLVQF